MTGAYRRAVERRRRSTWCSSARIPRNSTSCVAAIRRFGEHTVEAAAEHAPQEVERVGRDRPPGAARARPAERAALVEVEGRQLDRVTVEPAPGAAVEHRVHTLEREQLPEEGRGDERAAQVAERPQRTGEHAVERGVGLAFLGDLVGGFEHRHRVGEQRVLLAQRAGSLPSSPPG